MQNEYIKLTGLLKDVADEARISKTGKEYQYRAVHAFIDNVGQTTFSFRTLQCDVTELKKLVGQEVTFHCDIYLDQYSAPILRLCGVQPS